MSKITKEYIAVVHKDKDSEYGVIFPDFLECITSGKNLQEAKNMAEEALQFHIDGMLEDKEDLPEATNFDIIKQRYHDAEIFLFISVKIPTSVKRINITIDEKLLRKLDKYLNEKNDNRSHFFTESIKERISQRS